LVIHVDSQTRVMVEKTSFINSVINNILTNAIKFSHPDSAIEINASIADKKVSVSFRDNGIGIPDGILKDLFDLDKATSRAGTQDESGTGWGMPLVKNFVEAYGGKITITSSEKDTGTRKRGTEVLLTLRKG
jgi:two-component system, sensor histidine kinase and response regulator